MYLTDVSMQLVSMLFVLIIGLYFLDKDSYEFTELWSGEVLHSGKEALTVVVPAHGTKVFSVR